VVAFLEDVRYIVFDLNGTLVAENYLRHDEILEKTLKCRKRGRGLTAEDLREVAKGRRPLSELIATLYEVDDPETVTRRLLRIQASRTFFRERTPDVLKALRQKYKLILCSDTTGISKAVVKRLGLSRYFDRIFYSCDVGYLKGEEEFWTSMLSSFPEASPREFVVVGDDALGDIYYPRRLGMHTIQIENPLRLALEYREKSADSDEQKPEYYIKELEELLSILDLQKRM